MQKHQIKYGAIPSVSESGGISISRGVAAFSTFEPSKPNINSNEVYKVILRSFSGISDETISDGETAYFYVFYSSGYPEVIRDSVLRLNELNYIPVCVAWRVGDEVYVSRLFENYMSEHDAESDKARNVEYLSGIFGSPSDGDEDNVVIELPYDIEVTKFISKTDSGSATVQLFSGSRQIGSDLSSSTSQSFMVPSSDRIAMSGDRLSVRVTNVSSAINLEYQINYRKIFGDVLSRTIVSP